MKKYCPQCGAEFQCMHQQIEVCHCASVHLNDEARTYLKKNYSDCLCHKCLVEVDARFKNKETALKTKQYVFIAVSLDGYIADKDGGIDWLQTVPNPENDDMGYQNFIEGMDAIIMGRRTFETVCSFDIEWPYQIPVFVFSNSYSGIPEPWVGKVELLQGSLKDGLNHLASQGYTHIYIDGGKTIQSFLNEGLIDEITLTTIPILLGGGSPLFGQLKAEQNLKLLKSKVYLNEIVQSTYVKK